MPDKRIMKRYRLIEAQFLGSHQRNCSLDKVEIAVAAVIKAAIIWTDKGSYDTTIPADKKLLEAARHLKTIKKNIK